MVKTTHTLIGILLIFVANCGFAQNFLTQNENHSDSIPKILLPGIVSSELAEHGSIAISPTGDEIYWSRKFTEPTKQWSIMTSKLFHGHWSAPEIAEFSFEKYNCSDPAFSKDGNKLYFHTIHPVANDSLNNIPHIWYVERTLSSWTDPLPLSVSINEHFAASAFITANNTIYFTSNRPGSHGAFDLFKSTFNGTEYNSPENLGPTINTQSVEGRCAVDPNEKYIIFWSIGRSDSFGSGDLYISFTDENGNWQKPLNLGPNINSSANDSFPSLSPDGTYLFFMSNRTGNDEIYQIPIEALIESLRNSSSSND